MSPMDDKTERMDAWAAVECLQARPQSIERGKLKSVCTFCGEPLKGQFHHFEGHKNTCRLRNLFQFYEGKP